jgi:cysteine desulfurase family protein (TIGR01976 family)
MTQTANLTPEIVQKVRQQFPALSREVNGRPAVFFDGPAGSQVPQRVIDAVGHCLAQTNANHEGLFATSSESDAMLHEAHRAMADFLGADDPDCVCFGANMTTLTMALSRALARNWSSGDEIIVSRLGHDANVTPWVLAAEDAGATVRHIEIHRDDCTLNLDDLRGKLSEKTRLVAVGYASNASGSINPIQEITAMAHEFGAQVFVDAVHYAPHGRIDVGALGCDYLACSAYKFFGPHVGVMLGRRELLEGLTAYKLRPATDELPGKWMTGTQNHEGIAGTLAAVDYLADLGRELSGESLDRGAALDAAMAAIANYERELARRLIAGLQRIESVRIWGITDPAQFDRRAPTVSITHGKLTATEMATRLGERGIFTWHGNFYALPVTESLGLEPEGLLRIGLLHYNTAEEVDRLLEELALLD